MAAQRTDPPDRDQRPLVAVVGGGVAGLAAAWQLINRPAAPRVVLLESARQVGGKLAIGELDGLVVDLGAESMLARRPEGLDLARAVGLGEHLVAPRPVVARLWSGGGWHPLPPRTLMGVPSGAQGLRGLLTADGVARVAAEPATRWPAVDQDVDVATFVGQRVGSDVVQRLVEPLLGGVYAGRAGELSLQATVPALWAAAAEGRSAVDAAAGVGRVASAGPVFAGIRGGVGRLPVALAAALRAQGVDIQTGSTVRDLRRTPDGWRLVVGPTTDERVIEAQAVVLATPAGPTSRLLSAEVPSAATYLAEIDYASVAIVTVLLPRSAGAALPGSGFLVPPVEGRLVKAATFSSGKWGWLDAADEDRIAVRTSVGRHRDEADLQRADDDLVAAAMADLADLVQAPLPVLASRVTRWGGALPQYAVGHVQRVAAARAALAGAPGLSVAGAAYDGVGIPACIASGVRAAVEARTHLEQLAVAARG